MRETTTMQDLERLLQVEGRFLISYSVVDTAGAKTEADFKTLTNGYVDASVETVHWQLYKEANRLQKLMAQYECPHPAPVKDSGTGKQTCPDCEKIW